MNKGGGRQSPQVQGALREPPQASQGLTLGLGWGLGSCRNSFPAFLVVAPEGDRENRSDSWGPKVEHTYEVGRSPRAPGWRGNVPGARC